MSDPDVVISCLPQRDERSGGNVARLACAAPRRPARGRERDRLWGILSLEGLPDSVRPQEAAGRVAESFFGTAGSVTTALRAAVAALRALAASAGGNPSPGDMSLAVFRGGTLFLGIFGDAQAFLFKGGELLPLGGEQLEITLVEGQGSVPGRFAQVDLVGQEKLLLTAKNPQAQALRGLADSWASAGGQAVGAFVFMGGDALVADFRPGRGRLQVNEAERARVWAAQEAGSRAPAGGRRPTPGGAFARGGESGPAQVGSAGGVTSEPAGDAAPVPPPGGWVPKQEEPPAWQGRLLSVTDTGATVESAARVPFEAGAVEAENRERSGDAWQATAARAARGVWRGASKVGGWMGKLGRSLSPSGQARPQAAAPSRRGLVLLAVLLPLAVGLLGSLVYLRNGRAQAQQGYLASAQAYLDEARQTTDRVAQRGVLQKALSMLDEADALGQSGSSQALRQQVSQLQATLGGSGRIELLPLALGEELALGQVSALSAGGGDLYVLDQGANRILRLYSTEKGYVHDPQFSCGAAAVGTQGTAGAKLVAMTALSANDPFGSGILALDSAGNLWTCERGVAPQKQALTPPDSGWGLVSGLTYSNAEILVLDTQNNGLWRYELGAQGYDGTAHLFFDAQIPNLKDVVATGLLGDELYLLHETGQMSVCTYGALKEYKPTSCQDPAAFSDGGASQGTQALTLPGTQFVAMQVTQPPDASLYLLDRNQPALYRFSRQLGIDDVLELQLGQQTGGLASAFALAGDGTLFVSFGDRLYTAHLP
jgi:hypothetical protein